MEHRIRPNAKGYAEPVKGKPGVYRLYFSLGKDPETGKYLRSPKRTVHCKSKNPKNWPKECENALSAYRAELELDDLNGLFMRDIIREEVQPDDPRLR